MSAWEHLPNARFILWRQNINCYVSLTANFFNATFSVTAKSMHVACNWNGRFPTTCSTILLKSVPLIKRWFKLILYSTKRHKICCRPRWICIWLRNLFTACQIWSQLFHWLKFMLKQMASERDNLSSILRVQTTDVKIVSAWLAQGTAITSLSPLYHCGIGHRINPTGAETGIFRTK